jgi:cell division protein ZapA
MPQVGVTINGRTYSVSCGVGEEAHLLDLASYYDKQVKLLAEDVGQVGETRLLLLGGLMIADQLSDMVSKLDDLRAELNRLKGERTSLEHRASNAENKIADILDAASARVEEIVERLSAA